jgi:two-component system, OmpR family, response regulator ChvI
MVLGGKVDYNGHDSEIGTPSKSPQGQWNNPREHGGSMPVQEKNEVLFSNKSENYCICFIDIVGSTQITAKITPSEKVGKFYSTFINAVASIVKDHNGKIVKTVGDGVLFFFPSTSNIEDIEAFVDALECCLALISSRNTINSNLYEEKLPGISYRISAEYGRVEVAKSDRSASYDLFGTTVNFCAKINKNAPPNGIVIGSDLYTIVSSFPALADRYKIQEIGELHLRTGKRRYPIYELSGRHVKRTMSRNLIWNLVKSKVEFGAQGKSQVIMLIDDDPDILLLFTEYLKSAGMIVDSFNDPEKALAHFTRSNPSRYDLIITDIRMRHLNGLQLYSRFKDLDPNVRIIFVTALDMADEITAVMPEVEPHQFITKPINRDALISSVKKHLR